MTVEKDVRRKGTSVSLVIAMLLVTSGVVRLLGGTGAAIAREVAELSEVEAAAEDAKICIDDAEIDRLLGNLRGREGDVAARELAARQTEADLARAKEQMALQLANLQAAEEQLSATMALAAKASEGDLNQLTTVYENMKPKEAAAVFEQMDPGFAAGFLGRMNSEAAAHIFAGLQPSTAYAITVILAGRNLDAPTQ